MGIVKMKEKESGKSLIESMFEAGVHFGYSRSRRHPSFKTTIFGQKNGVDIVDLEKTGVQLAKALDFVKEMGSLHKSMLMVGTKPEAKKTIEEAALSLGVSYVMNRWIGGTLTNFSEIKKRIARMEDLLKKKEAGELNVYTKKERLLLDQEVEKLKIYFGGIAIMKTLPDFIFVIDPKHETTATTEARKRRLPIVALMGSDCDMGTVDYPIPGNDASVPSIKFFVNEIANAYTEGKNNPKTVEVPSKIPPVAEKK